MKPCKINIHTSSQSLRKQINNQKEYGKYFNYSSVDEDQDNDNIISY
jgi:hypothetical protein